MSCLSDDTVLALVHGQLDGPTLAIAEQHLAGCARCRAGVAAAARLFGRDASDADEASLAGLRGRRSATLARGTVIARYTILEPLGVGAAGIVYVAHDAQLRRRVALKVLPVDGEATRERWLREAQAMAQLAHPNVVTVHDAGVHEGAVFIAMELVGGKTLAEWSAERQRGWREILPVFLEAARGLAAAHAAGFVHRDFKPHNVLVGDDGRVRVTDFGLARALGDAIEAPGGDPPLGPSAMELTAAGTLIGTPAYMAPEQFARREVDARTDQFAFCVALYEACCGRRPFVGAGLRDLAVEVTSGHVPVPPATAAVPRWLFEALRRGLAVAPERRHATMNELIALFERGLARDERGPRRRRVLAGVVGAALAAAGATAFVLSVARNGRCGDGVVNEGEECDDGNASDTDACRMTCRRARCGDGVVRPVVEECDDGNTQDGDGCTAQCLACAGPADHVGPNGHCYTRHDEPLPFKAARQLCWDSGGDLVTYASGYELVEVLRALLDGRGTAFWTALARKQGQPFWDSDEPLPRNSLGIDWRPDASVGDGPCAVQIPTVTQKPMPNSGVWTPHRCSEATPFVCERTAWTVRPQSGHAYRVFWKVTPWQDARDNCRRAGAHLVTVTSVEEQAFVRGLFPGRSWLGGDAHERPAQFAWITREPFSYTNFAPHEPDGALPESNCLTVDVDGLWHDRQCINGYAFVCEID